MRRLLVLAALAMFACTEEDPAPFFVKLDYQVRCVECTPRSADDTARDVMALDGENGFAIECSVDEQGGDRVLTFSAEYTDPERPSRTYGLSLIQANIDAGDPGGSCLVVVSEGNNTYEGGCSGDEPDADNPCQVELEVDGAIVTGKILCENVPNQGSAASTRHVVEPGSLDPASFEVHGCAGL